MRRCMRNNVCSFGLCFSFAESVVLQIVPGIMFVLPNDSNSKLRESSRDDEICGLWAFIVVNYSPARYRPGVVCLSLIRNAYYWI